MLQLLRVDAFLYFNPKIRGQGGSNLRLEGATFGETSIEGEVPIDLTLQALVYDLTGK